MKSDIDIEVGILMRWSLSSVVVELESILRPMLMYVDGFIVRYLLPPILYSISSWLSYRTRKAIDTVGNAHPRGCD